MTRTTPRSSIFARCAALGLATLAVGCHHGAQRDSDGAGRATQLVRQMHADLAAVTTARQAIIEGNTQVAGNALSGFARHGVSSQMPEAWVPYYEVMQDFAGETAEARDPVGLANGVAMLAGMCGDCHAANGGGPGISPPSVPPLDATFASQMQRHAWAADRMWQGLVAPSAEEWTGGAAAMLEQPLAWADVALEGADAETIDAFGAYIYELGEDGIHAANSGQRSEIYGQFLSTCASCHAASRP